MQKKIYLIAALILATLSLGAVSLAASCSPSRPTLSATSGNGFVNLSWSSAQTCASYPKYLLSKGTSSGSHPFESLLDGTVHSYNDTNVANNGTQYYYIVRETGNDPSQDQMHVNSNEVVGTAYDPSSPTGPSFSGPDDRTVAAGDGALFSIYYVTGTPPLSYQWRRNGSNISGATSSSYYISSVASSDSGSTFSVVVTNSAASRTSRNATLTVAQLPSITSQPTSKTVTVGQTATFTVTANGTPPLRYNWRKNFSYISGATSSSYTTPPTVASDSGSTFDVVVSNDAGNKVSNSVTLTVYSKPTVTTLPPPSVTPSGATLSGSVNPNGDFTSAWFRYGTTDPVTCNNTFGTRAPLSGTPSGGSGSSSFTYDYFVGGASSTKYYYCAIAQNSVDYGFGSVWSFTTPSASAPWCGQPPTNLTATFNNGIVHLTWNRNPSCSASAGYEIQKTSQGSGSTFNASNTSYDDSNVPGYGTTYTYAVRETNPQQTAFSDYSNSVSITTPQSNYCEKRNPPDVSSCGGGAGLSNVSDADHCYNYCSNSFANSGGIGCWMWNPSSHFCSCASGVGITTGGSNPGGSCPIPPPPTPQPTPSPTPTPSPNPSPSPTPPAPPTTNPPTPPAPSNSIIQCGPGYFDDQGNQVKCDEGQFYLTLSRILKYFVFIAGIVVVLSIAVGGFFMLISAGSEERLSYGKRTITAAVIGLLITLTAWIIVNTVITTFTNCHGAWYVFKQFSCSEENP